ncbi:hypothetical protein Pla108_39830 [Botrimarina colliarenosi]|uniref:PEP-CTERM protein-sorting domain-containing protein n=1 Tax=Botrimarina colliarenosi TaxID=2528001 RepID=A0A5C6A367_9BACT|nr:PEP-CTERM sorting domain-containing protein [Botrimarina colliarenosi]TWT92843.1 hypothetical protein Pla108_39830 [Botrimarina colliarenosi]
MSLHRLKFVAVVSMAAAASLASAQSPGVLYTWDHSFGSALGDSVEGWSYGFGAGATTLSNATDGVLTVTESVAGSDWAISDGFNVAKESAANASGGFFDAGGTDLLGLTEFELDISHNGANSISGQLFFQPDDGSGCCGFFTSSSFTVDPGGMSTVSVSFAGSGISADQLEFVRAIGVQIFGSGEASPLTWELGELRSVGPGLSQRVIADYSLSPANLENAVVKFDELGISGGAADSQAGLSLLSGALRWVDLGGTGDPGDESGGAVAWGNGNALAVDFSSRPLDISNYDFAEVTMKATAGAGGASEVGVQFFAQYADRADSNAFNYGGTSQTLTADGAYHTLSFPLAALGAGGDLDLTQWIGLNLDPHAGGALQIQVQSVVLTTIPEPGSAALVLIVGLAASAVRRR